MAGALEVEDAATEVSTAAGKWLERNRKKKKRERGA